MGELTHHQVHEKSKKFVNDNRKIITKAWIGREGQEEYEMTIYFGKKSLSKYARGLDLRKSIPSENSMNWFNINTDNNTIELKLN